jgi:hypothetical protein
MQGEAMVSPARAPASAGDLPSAKVTAAAAANTKKMANEIALCIFSEVRM